MSEQESIRTKEISEAALFYMHGLSVTSYVNKHWHFAGNGDKAKELRMALVNKKVSVEPLEFLEAVRRMKAFSNEAVGI